MQYKGRGQGREPIYQMNTVAAKLDQLGMEVIDNMLMEFVLKSLPPKFDHIVSKSINGVLKISLDSVLKKNSG